MKRVTKVLMGLLAAVALLAIGLFVACSGVSVDAVSGLIGVVIGASLATLSRLWDARVERIHRLRLAALDERLRAHQEAYALWRRLVASVHDSERIGQAVADCQEWWESNCLYLTAEAREAFLKAYLSAYGHAELLKARTDAATIKANWDVIMSPGRLIVQGVHLPTIGDHQADRP